MLGTEPIHVHLARHEVYVLGEQGRDYAIQDPGALKTIETPNRSIEIIYLENSKYRSMQVHYN